MSFLWDGEIKGLSEERKVLQAGPVINYSSFATELASSLLKILAKFVHSLNMHIMNLHNLYCVLNAKHFLYMYLYMFS